MTWLGSGCRRSITSSASSSAMLMPSAGTGSQARVMAAGSGRSSRRVLTWKNDGGWRRKRWPNNSSSKNGWPDSTSGTSGSAGETSISPVLAPTRIDTWWMRRPRLLSLPLQHLEGGVDRRVNDPAVIHPQQTVGGPVGEAQLAISSADRKTRLVAVVPRLEHANRRPHQVIRLGFRKPPDAAKLVDHDAMLELELQGVVGMLPATPAAAGLVRGAGGSTRPGAGR